MGNFRISFERTLRLPDDGKEYPLPPGLGEFPVLKVEDFAGKVPDSWLESGLSDSALAPLRALEHAIAVLVIPGDSRGVYRQSKMKTAVSLERNGLFGIKTPGIHSLQ